MTEQAPDVIEMFSFIFKFLLTITVVFIIILVTYNLKTEIEIRSVERLSSDVMENYASLSYYKSVFDKTELARLNNTLTELAYDCSTGSHVTITNLKDGGVYEFGYKGSVTSPKIKTKSTYNTGIRLTNKINNFYYESVLPASIEIELLKTDMTEITCLAQRAFDTKTEQNMTVSCLISDVDGNCIYPIEFITAEKKLCFYGDALVGQRTYPDCRQIKMNIRVGFSKKDNGFNSENKAILKALPLKSVSSLSLNSPCSSYDSLKAGANDNVQEVVLCIQEIR